MVRHPAIMETMRREWEGLLICHGLVYQDIKLRWFNVIRVQTGLQFEECSMSGHTIMEHVIVEMVELALRIVSIMADGTIYCTKCLMFGVRVVKMQWLHTWKIIINWRLRK